MRHLSILLLILGNSISMLGQKIVWDTTFNQNGSNFEILEYNDYVSVYYIIQDNSDTTITDVYGDLEIVDFDHNGFQDLFFTKNINFPIHELFLFDQTTNKFRRIENMINYSEPKPIEKSENLFYTYRRGGCADMNWTSILIKLEDFEINALGSIYGHGCTTDDMETEIQIRKFNSGTDVTLIETIPWDTLSTFENTKWDFIEKYWTRNFEEFK